MEHGEPSFLGCVQLGLISLCYNRVREQLLAPLSLTASCDEAQTHLPGSLVPGCGESRSMRSRKSPGLTVWRSGHLSTDSYGNTHKGTAVLSPPPPSESLIL